VHTVHSSIWTVSSFILPIQMETESIPNKTVWAKYYSNGFDAQAAAKYEGDCSKAAIDACHDAKLTHIVYSSLDDIKSKERPCPHFASKAAGE
jgi:hypothetical protein